MQMASLMSMMASSTLLTALDGDKDDLDALTFTSGGATGPQVEALRDAVVEVIDDLVVKLNSDKTAALLGGVLGGQGGGDNATMIALALSGSL